MRRILTRLAACGLAFGMSIGIAGRIPGRPVAEATGISAAVESWTVLGAARSLPTLSRPAALAVGGRGNVYVSDTGNHRIVEIAPDGRPLAHFGDADLRPEGPSGLAVSAADTIYAADSFHRAIQVYSPGHRRVARWPVDIPGASGTQLAVAVGGGGTVIVAAAPESRCTIPYGPPACATSYLVQRRTSSGRLLGQFRTPVAPFGAANAIVTQLSVAVDPAGHIYVAVAGNEPCYKDCRVYHFLIEHRPDGRVLGHWGTDELDPTANWTAVAIGGRGPSGGEEIFLADDYNPQIEKRAPGGRVLARWPVGTFVPAPLECSTEPLAVWQVWQTSGCPGLAGVAVARNGTVYASDPGSGRILVLSSGGRLLAQWGAGGSAPGRFWFPASVELDAQGQPWVDDMANGRVQSLGADGRFHVRFTVAHPGTGMAVDRQGNVYIGQRLGRQVGKDVVISKFSPSGTLLARWSNLNLGDPPSGIAIAPNGDVVVVSVCVYPPSRLELDGSNILRLSPAGKQLSLIHLGYFGPGSSIAVDAQENITIAYGTTPHVERYSSSGTLLASWGAPKPALVAWGFPSPAFISLDAAGHIYLADTLQNQVKEYAAIGTLLHTWGSAGSYPGQLHHPGGIALAPDGTLYVSDTENHRIQRLLR